MVRLMTESGSSFGEEMEKRGLPNLQPMTVIRFNSGPTKSDLAFENKENWRQGLWAAWGRAKTGFVFENLETELGTGWLQDSNLFFMISKLVPDEGWNWGRFKTENGGISALKKVAPDEVATWGRWRPKVMAAL
ncbi:hypothetical protein COLO4_20324 [Corchorus olitorius]|uniref:Uncharacterized protein n=1 Tax=Corchorus olitorius TaxID=93759 RepID=A0A1R3J0D4_9ROSI|nr:hypothetical protein COLO4_20324 [Corchorus olitorius]